MRGNQWKKPPIADRFWEKVRRGAPDECWPWTGYVREYGAFLLRKGRYAKAHRFAWELVHGPIPEGMCVCHSCDNPPCCNPAHLFLGTRADNNLDKERKGRGVRPNALKTHCPQGHEYTPENTYRYARKDGGAYRVCRTCVLARVLVSSRARRASARAEKAQALPYTSPRQ